MGVWDEEKREDAAVGVAQVAEAADGDVNDGSAASDGNTLSGGTIVNGVDTASDGNIVNGVDTAGDGNTAGGMGAASDGNTLSGGTIVNGVGTANDGNVVGDGDSVGEGEGGNAESAVNKESATGTEPKTVQETIEDLERQIAQLPIGYISRKMIHGKMRFYRQWTENGRIKSQYIKDGQLQSLEEGIEKRRALQKQLKDLRAQQAAERGAAARTRSGYGRQSYAKSSGPKFCTNVVIGEALKGLAENLRETDRRACFEKLKAYLDGRVGDDGRVCLITGLRRTGKTTLIRQAIHDMTPEQAERAAYIKVTAADSMERLNQDLKTLFAMGCRYVFIDEVTLINDFIDDAAILSDVHAAQGMRVVLTGTDSLAFCLALRQELYDRAVSVNTTFIPFREHRRLLGIDDVDEYIRYGGTLRAGEKTSDGVSVRNATFRDGESTEEYLKSAVCRNIERSLVGSKDLSQFRGLRALQESGDLLEIIDRVMVNMNLNFLLLILAKNPAYQNLRLAAWNLRNDRAREEQAAGITRVHAAEVKQALVEMDLVVECPAETPQPGSEPIERVIFTQPGIRYCHIRTLLHSLMGTEKFVNMSELYKKELVEKVLEDVRARMLEDLILLETEKAMEGRHQIYKLQISTGVFGMVVYDTVDNTCMICELRKGIGASQEQIRRLADADKYAQIEKRFGKIRQRFVLCDEPVAQEGTDAEYCRVEDYLCGLIDAQ